ncbi:hypothetical protein niasHS_000910 [Heterodera schachtii]|uniref:Uncharacterized protein n=1 Tax=Heterodera schachtii TaxID=97005 RepID=A0ABD2KIG1_HETSC
MTLCIIFLVVATVHHSLLLVNAVKVDNVQIEAVHEKVQKLTDQLEKEDILRKDPKPLLITIEEIYKMAQQNGQMPLVMQLDNELAMEPNCDKDKDIEIFKDDEQHILVEKVTNFIKENGKQIIEHLRKNEKEQKITTISGFNGTLAEFLAQKSGSETEAHKLFLSVKNLFRVISHQLDAEGKAEEGKDGIRYGEEAEERTEGKGCDKKHGDKGKGQIKEENANAGEGKANANNRERKAYANDGDKDGVLRRRKVRKVKDEVQIREVNKERSVRVGDKKQNKAKLEKEKTKTKKVDDNGMEKGENEAVNVQKIIKKTLATNEVLMPSDLLQLLMQLWPQVLLLGAEGGPADASAANDGKTSPRGHRRRKRSPQAEIEKTACVLLAILSFFESWPSIFALTIAGICCYKLMKTDFYHRRIYNALTWLNNGNRIGGYQFH